MKLKLLTEISYKEVLKYLGFRGGTAAAEYERIIERIGNEIIENATPKVCSAVLEIEHNAPLRFKNCDVRLLGKDIQKHLENSQECIFMGATLGSIVDRMIKKAMVCDMAEAVIYDACASAAIENVCDNYSAKLAREFETEGKFLTERFSPGYGDMPLENQRELCEVLDSQKRIGLTFNRSFMLEPTKSVTALIGVTDKMVERRKSCGSCRLFFECEFRKKGVTCYEQTKE